MFSFSNFASRGVVLVNDGTVLLSNCSFSNNLFTHSILNVVIGQLTIFNCTFTNNTSAIKTGAISSDRVTAR